MKKTALGDFDKSGFGLLVKPFTFALLVS